MTKDVPNPSLRTTTATTDTEAGAEQLPPEEDKKQSLKALKAMYDRGLIPEDEYQDRLKDLDNG